MELLGFMAIVFMVPPMLGAVIYGLYNYAQIKKSF